MKPYYDHAGITSYHENCLYIMRHLDLSRVAMVLSDPPYGTTQNKWDSVIPLFEMWDCLKGLKANIPIVMTSDEPFTSALISSNYKMFRYCWYWKKSQATGHLNSYKMPMKLIEPIPVFYRRLPNYNPILIDKPKEDIRSDKRKEGRISQCYGTHSKRSNRRIEDNQSLPNQILEYPSPQNNYHPNEKPLGLCKYLIQTYTNHGDLILDFAMGSGTTLKAAKELGRKAIGIETEDRYIKIAVKRLKQEVLDLDGE